MQGRKVGERIQGALSYFTKVLAVYGAVDAAWKFRIHGFRLRVCDFSPSLSPCIASSAAVSWIFTCANTEVCWYESFDLQLIRLRKIELG